MTKAIREPEQQGAMHSPGGGLHVGKRIGEADGTAGNGRGDVEERYADGVAAAFVDPDVSGQGGDEFLAAAMILHVLRGGFGIGEHLPGGIDDGGAGTSGQGLLRSDVLQGMLAVDFDAVGEKAGLGR